jgi:hypothetical protein
MAAQVQAGQVLTVNIQGLTARAVRRVRQVLLALLVTRLMAMQTFVLLARFLH